MEARALRSRAGAKNVGTAGIDRELELLLRKLYTERGLDAHHFRPSYIERRLKSRLRAARVDSYREYRRFLDEHPEEYNPLLNALTINVTGFFRDRPVFEFFANRVVPELIQSKTGRRQHLVRVWSAGCATGEEPYSVAMILAEAAAGRKFGSNISVHATDIDERSLETAKEATYPKKELQSVPAHFRGGCEAAGAGQFAIAPEIRQLVKFRRLDLFADKPIAAVDIVFCRNVLIYFDRRQQERIIASFHSALNRGGYLVIGKTEKLGGVFAEKFEALSSRERVYRRRD